MRENQERGVHMGKQNKNEAESFEIEIRQIDPKTFVMMVHGGLKIGTHEKFLESFRTLSLNKGTIVLVETDDSFCISTPGYLSLATAFRELNRAKGHFAVIGNALFLEEYEILIFKKSVLPKFDSVEKAIAELRK